MNDYEDVEYMRSGSFGQVYLARHKKDKKKYVIKKMRVTDISDKDKENIKNEVALLEKLRHPNIVAYRDSFTEGDCLNLVMSYCEGGDLYFKIKENEDKHFSENVSNIVGVF